MTVTVCGRGIRASSRARFRERARAAACRRVQLWRRLSNWSDEVCVETDEDESAPDDVICKPRFLGSHKLHYGEVRLCPLLFIQRKCWPFSFVLYDQREHSPATGTVETAERALIGNDWNSSRRCARLLFQSGTLFDAAKSDLQWAISVQSLRSQPRAARARLRVLFGPPAPLSSPACFSLLTTSTRWHSSARRATLSTPRGAQSSTRTRAGSPSTQPSRRLSPPRAPTSRG